MRRISGGDKAKKFMTYLIGFIMVGSVFGVIFFGFGAANAATAKYNGFKFVNKGNFWSTNVNGREALFTYFPADAEQVQTEDDAISRLKGAIEIDATSDFNDTLAEPIALAQFQMGTTLFNFNIFVRSGFTAQYQNIPAITCNHATASVPVVYFKSSNETKIYTEGNCIVAEALNAADAIRAKDRMVYGLLGVI